VFVSRSRSVRRYRRECRRDELPRSTGPPRGRRTPPPRWSQKL